MKVVFFTPDLEDNSIGRTYCLWQLATALGWNTTVVSTRGRAVWPPLADTDFARNCVRLTENEMRDLAEIADADVFIAVKPLDESFLVARKLGRALRTPILLDIDDPDLEVRLSWDRPVRRILRIVLRRKQINGARRLRAAAREVPTIVSNPVLQARYGGPIIPHIRDDMGVGSIHETRVPTVAFVGTNRAHKGIDILRSAVANLQTEGYRLIITDDEPDDSKPWEQWTGATSMAEGIRIVASSDVVIIPSINLAYARGQLPAKLMDAMMLGRAIAVTNIEPMPWALGSGGRVILPGSVEAVEEVLVEFRDPLVRKNLGTLARARALALFVASPYIDVFHNAVNDAISQSVPISPS